MARTLRLDLCSNPARATGRGCGQGRVGKGQGERGEVPVEAGPVSSMLTLKPVQS